MKVIKAITAGFAGAIALNLLHETVRRFDSGAPRIDLLGEEALSKSAKILHLAQPDRENLYPYTLTGDIISNAAYYTMIGMGGKKGVWTRAAVLGLSAGVGAVKLPEPLGLHDEPVADTERKTIMTIGYYVFGALITAAAFQLLSRK